MTEIWGGETVILMRFLVQSRLGIINVHLSLPLSNLSFSEDTQKKNKQMNQQQQQQNREIHRKYIQNLILFTGKGKKKKSIKTQDYSNSISGLHVSHVQDGSVYFHPNSSTQYSIMRAVSSLELGHMAFLIMPHHL